MDGLIALALAKKYTDKVGQDIISAGFRVQVEQDRSILETTGEEKVLYLLPKASSNLSSDDGYDEFVYANNKWEWVGKTDVDLDYELLSNKPQINGYTLSGNKSADDLRLMSEKTITGVFRNNIHVDYPYNFNKDIYLERDIYINEDSYNNHRYRVGVQDNFFRDYSGTMGVIKYGEYYFDSIKSSYAFCGCFLFQKSDLRNVPSFIDDLSGNIQIIQLFTPHSYTGNGSSLIRCVIGKDSTSQQLKIYFQNAYVTLQQDGSYTVSNQSDWQELTGGSQIVSGVVNANGTITFTDSDGNTFTTTGSSIIGPQGDDYVLTAQDKSDIADIVLSELPNADTMSF